MIPRRFLRLPVIGCFFALCGILLYTIYSTGHINKLNPYTYTTGKAAVYRPASGKPAKVILLESGGSHEEVTTAFLTSLVETTTKSSAFVYPFFKLVRFQMGPIMKETIGNHTNVAKYVHSDRLKEYKTRVGRPDVVLSVTCEHDSKEHSAVFNEWLEQGVSLVCVVHHADRWFAESDYGHYKRLAPWIQKGQVTFVTLSDHVDKHLKDQAAATWKQEDRDKLKAKVFVPVFRAPTRPHKSPMQVLGLNLQGDFDPKRRDYKSLFGQLAKIADSMSAIKMYLVGHGVPPEVPEQIKSKVEFKSDLSFTDFYGHMSEGLAILPAFASDDYYSEKASSSVPASIIAGVPLVAAKKLLDAYTYLSVNEVWFAEEGETDIDAIHRLVTQIPSPEALEQQLRFRQRKLLNKRESLIRLNGRTLVSLLQHSTGTDESYYRKEWEWEW
ncbi:hypothetical protein CJU90_5996 [Yarrowia sp. C11]|nr:hypothetical protein CJU90_5996 [Yarrowia sp. C11]KAG5370713.1 hypothetical protein CKK34_0837 [Yarrowia sp. E02]